MSTKRIPVLALFLLGAFAAAAIGSFATFSGVAEWYPTLNRPAWTPPRGLFAPVWTFLYVMMAFSAWRVWRKTPAPGATVGLYASQLVLNALWSVLFFGLRRPDLALVDIVMLLALLVAILARFARVDRIATLCWAPYVAWVAFATALNVAIVHLNA